MDGVARDAVPGTRRVIDRRARGVDWSAFDLSAIVWNEPDRSRHTDRSGVAPDACRAARGLPAGAEGIAG